MAIRSIDGSSGGMRQALDANRSAAEAEKEAQRRIEQSARRVEEARSQDDLQLDRVREQHQALVDRELEREQSELQAVQNRGYERILSAQRAQSQHMNELKRQGDKDYAHLQEHYRSATRAEERRGSDELDRLTSQNHRKIQYEQGLGNQQIEAVRKESEAQSNLSRDRQAERIANLYKENDEQYARLSEQSHESRGRAAEKFASEYEKTLRDARETLEDLNERVGRQLKQARMDTSARLDAYRRRQSDPFYKMVDLGASLHENGTHYFLTAVIPPHEQGHVTVSIKGDQIVLSGYRNNSEQAEVSPGHNVGTASFQSFEETFPLAWPVDKNKLSREFDGERLIVSVPKKNQYAFRGPYEPAPPQKARVEPPRFPENIHIDPELAINQPEPEKPRGKREPEATPPSSRTRSSGTLA